MYFTITFILFDSNLYSINFINLLSIINVLLDSIYLILSFIRPILLLTITFIQFVLIYSILSINLQ